MMTPDEVGQVLLRLEKLEKNLQPNGWRIDKRVNVSTMFAIGAALVGIILYISGINTQVAVNTNRIDNMAQTLARIDQTLLRIDEALDGKEDRIPH